MFYKEEFYRYLEGKGYWKETIGDYQSILNKFECFLEKKKINDEKTITKRIILQFFDTFMNKGMITKHQRGEITRIIHYFRYLEDTQKIFLSPIKDYIPPKFYHKSYPTLRENEMKMILDKIQTNKTLYIQGLTIIELMYSSALRPREIYNLKLEDIDYKNKMLFIEQSKNKKDRFVPVGDKALSCIDRYTKEVRPLYLKDKKNNFIFINERTGKQLTCRGTRYVVQKTLNANGIKLVKPYSLRSTAATALLTNGMPIEYISSLLGHVDLRTTQIYLKIKKYELEKVLIDKHPRNVNSKEIKD